MENETRIDSKNTCACSPCGCAAPAEAPEPALECGCERAQCPCGPECGCGSDCSC